MLWVAGYLIECEGNRMKWMMLMALASVGLTACAKEEVERIQVPPPNVVQKAYIDPATGELATPPKGHPIRQKSPCATQQ